MHRGSRDARSVLPKSKKPELLTVAGFWSLGRGINASSNPFFGQGSIATRSSFPCQGAPEGVGDDSDTEPFS
ncbi:MAG: hypothetical protein AUI50_03645 [Crenarchaeota archaeon 13_1_40CM_2_52_14]|nr:MAG: hypothetical protein AUI97_00325 [Crenarchaeota archaeon 13_1_40CM_3_52_17]OLD35078.1 MAG: hypothetical protein AUI50_03645 [Crenarchaeota archaeon 13_1_40CM_2_52_14]OLE71269.1 MAG: hypothetical protein AUF78_02970 [archaeon 13_1_20CM_2_51_12]